jgi:hypothetical protein
MHNAALFNRPPGALLHVGLYIRKEATLVPIFRYGEYEMDFAHRPVPIGSGYIGRAYTDGSEDTLFYAHHPRPVAELDLVELCTSKSGHGRRGRPPRRKAIVGQAASVGKKRRTPLDRATSQRLEIRP